MNQSIRVNISFKNEIKDIVLYNYLKTKRSISGYMKDLIEADMIKQQQK